MDLDFPAARNARPVDTNPCENMNPTEKGQTNTIKRLPRRPPLRFPRAAVRLLEEWLVNHRDAPYATQDEQDELKLRTGLKRSQIMNWFANARKRGKIRALQPQPSPAYKPEPVPAPLFPQVANLHPFERWLHLGPEHEAASLSAIYEAIEAETWNCEHDLSLAERSIAIDHHSGTSTNWQYFRKAGSSISSLEIRSYAANEKSVCSDQWKHVLDGSSLPLTKLARRHRRMDAQKSTAEGEWNIRKSLRKFQCTFCNDCFKKKHDWQRHEKSQHLPLEKWICCPQGSVNVDPATYEITCVFCNMPDPDPGHIHSHGYTQCISRTPAERTFYRKDHLRQHLRLMHNGCPMTSSMDTWKSCLTILRSRCGFCCAELSTWEGRVEHLADHFRDGALMDNWDGDWGFDPDIMAMLERATSPSARQKSVRQLAELSIQDDHEYEFSNADNWYVLNPHKATRTRVQADLPNS